LAFLKKPTGTSSNKPDFQRAQKTDFEYYKSPTKIEIYISITK